MVAWPGHRRQAAPEVALVNALLIDGLNLVHRIYAAVPGDVESAAHFDGVLVSCGASLRRALHRHRPTHAVCVFDGDGKSWRHALYPQYKSGRPPMPEPLRRGLVRIQEAFAGEGVRSVSVAGYEADDVIATLAQKIAAHGGEATILSTDKMFCQLIGPRVHVVDHFAGRYLDEKYVMTRFGVRPAQLLTLFALVGDRSVNVSGVKSVGVHTAAKLIGDHGELDAILAAAASIEGALGAKLRDGAEQAVLARDVLRLKCDVHVGVNLRELRYPGGDCGV